MAIAICALRQRLKADFAARMAGLQGRSPVGQANLALVEALYKNGGQILFPAWG